jgi:NADH:ubiquinone oxidoreductase subunit 5 (subunit L)/multisubunit Na+/H+ antiporter MnhA subunit
MIGLFFLAGRLGTLDITALLHNAEGLWRIGSLFPAIAALLLLIGALGKSAQIPLQIWLPDAMAGPTPVSALIHSATMVVAGVYLIARMHPLFLLAPHVLFLVAIIGAATLLLAGCAALAQRDIKRILAYSTISQIGYMFLALGVGAFSAAIFHFLTHAFFKSLLFLCAGVVIRYCNEEHDIFKMHGLRKNMPFVFIAFLIGSCSLAALPFITAGFFSKDEIILSAWSSSMGGKWLWLCAEVGAFLTALYTFRLLFKVFFGSALRGPAGHNRTTHENSFTRAFDCVPYRRAHACPNVKRPERHVRAFNRRGFRARSRFWPIAASPMGASNGFRDSFMHGNTLCVGFVPTKIACAVCFRGTSSRKRISQIFQIGRRIRYAL